MADKQTQALRRLTKKLNALRKTLRADERNLLDRMILGDEAAAEVVAHRMTPKAANKAAEVMAHRMTPKAVDKAAEVVAHRMTPKAVDKAAEVVAHRMTPKASGASRPMISFDSANGNYVVADEEPEVEGHRMQAAVTERIDLKAT